MTITPQEYETRLKALQKAAKAKRQKKYCRKEYYKAYYIRNREKIIEQQRVYRQSKLEALKSS